jgi:cell division protein FtsL
MEMNTGKTKKSLVSKVFFVVCVVALIAVASGIFQQYMKRQELDTEVNDLKDELARLNMDKSDFLKSIDAFSGDFFLEQEARLKFNLRKDGEKVVVIPLDEKTGLPAETASDSQNYEENSVENFKAWWKYFFGVQT